jgi:hypothetical protein
MPFIPFTDKYLEDGTIAVTAQERAWARAALGDIGQSFHEAWADATDSSVGALMKAVDNLSAFTILVENYVAGRPSARPPAALTDQRNLAQHALISLSSAQELNAKEQIVPDNQYESCRLAMIAYSFLVVFPFPPTVRLFERLIERLQHAVINLRQTRQLAMARHNLQVWILSMGALLSLGLPERAWFVDELAQTVDLRQIGDRESFVQVLQGFLWHPKTSARDGLELWRDVEASRQEGRQSFRETHAADRA